MSQFGAEKFTTRARAAIEAAQVAASTSGHSATEPVHLLAALLDDAEGSTRTLVTRAGVDVDGARGRRPHGARRPAARQRRHRAAARRLPRHHHACSRRRSSRAADLKDDYVASEHLLLALAASGATQELLARRGLTVPVLEQQLAAVRGNRRVTSPDAESTFEALEKYSVDLTEARRGGQARPGHRP